MELTNRLLTEGSRDNILQPYLDLVNSRLERPVSMSVFKKYMLGKLATEAGMYNLSLGSNFYLAGAIRYYLNGDLTVNKRLAVYTDNGTDKFRKTVCEKLNEIILILRNKYIDTVGKKFSQPEDFGKLSLEALIRKYDPAAKKAVVPKEEKPVVKQDKASRNYTYDICLNQSDLKKYAKFTAPYTWCITTAQGYVNTYTSSNNSFFVIFARKGYEDMTPSVGKGYPLDNYGTSLMAIQMSKNGPQVVAGTSRWNHGGTKNGINAPKLETGADKVITNNKKLFEVLGVGEDTLQVIHQNYLKYKETAKTRKSTVERNPDTIRKFKYIQMLVNNGQPIDKLAHAGLLYGSGKIGNSLYDIYLKEGERVTDDHCLMWHGNVLYNTTLNQKFRSVGRNDYHDDKERFGNIFYTNRGGYGKNVYFDVVTGKKISAEGEITFNVWNHRNTENIYELRHGDYVAFYDNKSHKVITSPYGDQLFSEEKIHGDYVVLRPKNNDGRGSLYIFNESNSKFVQGKMPDGHQAYDFKDFGVEHVQTLSKGRFHLMFEKGSGILDATTGKIVVTIGGEKFESVMGISYNSSVCFVFLKKGWDFNNGWDIRGWLYDLDKKQRVVANFTDTDGYPIQVGEFSYVYDRDDAAYVKTDNGYWLAFDGTTNQFIKMGHTYRYEYYYGGAYENGQTVLDNTTDERVKDYLNYVVRYEYYFSSNLSDWSAFNYFAHIRNIEGQDDYIFTPYGLKEYKSHLSQIESRKEMERENS